MRTAQTATAKTLLIVASRIRTPAKKLRAMIENGLTMRQAVEDDECGQKRYGKDSQSAQPTGHKYGFSCVHNPSNFVTVA